MPRNDSFFVRVDAREFKRRLNSSPGCGVRRRAFETVILDAMGDVLAIMHAAAIDERGRCHPTEYYLRRVDPPRQRLRLVA
jgi:hypothetical protein